MATPTLVASAFQYAGTTGNVNTVGATVIFIQQSGSTVGTPTDNQGNTYTSLGSLANIGTSALYYCLNPTTSATHTFTSNGSLLSFVVAAFSNVAARDGTLAATNTTNNGGGTTIQPGSLTASASGYLHIIGWLTGNFNAISGSVNSGFSIAGTQNLGDASHYGSGIAYKVGTGAAENPTLTMASGNGGLNIGQYVFTATGPATETGDGAMAFSGISFAGSGSRVESGDGTMAFSGISFSGSGSHTETGNGVMAFSGISFAGAGTAAHTAAGNMAFAGISIAAGGFDAGAPGGLRQFWTM